MQVNEYFRLMQLWSHLEVFPNPPTFTGANYRGNRKKKKDLFNYHKMN